MPKWYVRSVLYHNVQYLMSYSIMHINLRKIVKNCFIFLKGLSLDSSGTVCTDDRVGSCYLDNRQGICSKEVRRAQPLFH